MKIATNPIRGTRSANDLEIANAEGTGIRFPAARLLVVVEHAKRISPWEMVTSKNSGEKQRSDILDKVRRFADGGLNLQTPGIEQSLPNLSDKEDAVYYRQLVSTEPSGITTRSGREYLDAFFGIKNATDALAFLNRYGSPDEWLGGDWDEGQIELVESVHGKRPEVYMWWGRIRELQELLRKAAITPLHKWGKQVCAWAMPTQVVPEVRENRPPALVYRQQTGALALFAQIFFERVAGTGFAWCELEDCGTPFRKTRPDKKFCSIDCQHLAVIRNSRSRAKKSRRSAKGGKK